MNSQKRKNVFMSFGVIVLSCACLAAGCSKDSTPQTSGSNHAGGAEEGVADSQDDQDLPLMGDLDGATSTRPGGMRPEGFATSTRPNPGEMGGIVTGTIMEKTDTGLKIELEDKTTKEIVVTEVTKIQKFDSSTKSAVSLSIANLSIGDEINAIGSTTDDVFTAKGISIGHPEMMKDGGRPPQNSGDMRQRTASPENQLEE